MSGDSHADELSDERAAQRRYIEAVERLARRPLYTQGSRSLYWTGTGATRPPQTAFGELVGRVALDGPDHSHLEGSSDFYIGDCHYDLDGVEVFSWSAPVACTFFRGTRHHALCDVVAVTRTYAQANGTISGFVDEALIDDPPPEPFKRRVLDVAAPPVRPKLPTRRPPSEGDAPSQTERPPVATGRPEARELPNHLARPKETPRSPAAPIRAAGLLQSRLAAPRQARLSSVLSTLQADQYEIVAAPGGTSRIVEGQPGTGKTIIAAHRAAFLVSPVIDPSDRPGGKVLLVGPSREYSDHVAGLISRLAPSSRDLEVIALPRLLELITEQNEDQLRGQSSYTWQDVDHELADLCVQAISRMKRGGSRRYAKLAEAVQDVYEMVRSNGGEQPLTDDDEWRPYLHSLPVYDRARSARAQQPLLAYIVGRVHPTPELKGIKHVIVDEAQDVHPLEWDVLYELNAGGHWTILGDLNQRRSDHTEPSWQLIADRLNILENDKAPVTRLLRGYRSTRPIIQYSNRLLAKSERELESLQREGPEPKIVRTATLDVEAATQGEVLLDRYAEGTVAIIGVDPNGVRNVLRERGWVAERGNRRRWTKDGRVLAVIHPDRARGLEFDGVVVVEPSDFRQNYGRQGQLYTALTRPNRELVVVHKNPLPEQLRLRRR